MTIPSIAAYPLPAAASLPVNRVKWQIAPRRAVLLIHDMQDYFLRFYGEDNPLRQGLVANIGRLRDWADESGVPVVYTAQPTEQSAADRALLNDMWGPGLTVADPALQRVTPALAPRAHDTVLVKWRYSAFHRSDLETRMRDWDRDQLIIAGVYAHIGCMTTALDAFMRDIRPFLVADALADFSEAEHRMALTYVAGRCGVVLDTDSVALAGDRVAWLRQRLPEHVRDAGVAGDDNLVDHGLDSLEVMQLVAEYERAGVRVSFEELAASPTLDAWAALFDRRLAA